MGKSSVLSTSDTITTLRVTSSYASGGEIKAKCTHNTL